MLQYVYDDVEHSAEEIYCIILKLNPNIKPLSQAEVFYFIKN